jgi:putative tryptophan/tyrosine transport system substrate-binding protein
MKRRAFMGGLGSLAAWPQAAQAQARRKPYRIGILETLTADLNQKNMDAFHAGMRERGQVQGESYIVEYRSAGGQNERFSELVADLLRIGVDIIVTRGTPAALAAKNASTTIPVVMAAVGEPLGIVASLARPGGNITGLTALSRELAAKRVEILKEAVPSVQRVGALLNLGNPTLQADWEEIQRAAGLLGITAVLLDVRSQEAIAPAFAAAVRERVDGLVVSNDSLSQTNAQHIVDLAAKTKLPTSFASREFVEIGGLMTYSVNYADLYRRAATFVDKILKGTKPEDLPVEQPTRFELVINLKTATQIGLTLSPAILIRADEVIE